MPALRLMRAVIIWTVTLPALGMTLTLSRIARDRQQFGAACSNMVLMRSGPSYDLIAAAAWPWLANA